MKRKEEFQRERTAARFVPFGNLSLVKHFFLLEEKAISIPLTTIYFDGTIYVVLRILREEHRHRQRGLFLRSFVFSGKTPGAKLAQKSGNPAGCRTLHHVP